MARINKIIAPHPLSISKTLATLIELFPIESEEKARALFEQAILCIYEESNFQINVLLRHNLDSAFALIRSISPRDDFEKLCCAQVILGQILGMHKISQPYFTDHRIGLKLLKLSTSAMQRIYEKRNSNNFKITK